MIAFILAVLLSQTQGIPLAQFETKEACETAKQIMLPDIQPALVCVAVKIKEA